MSNNYFIGDLHLGHKNILKYRDEFDSIEDHDNTITENIRRVYSKRNTLWLLGDCFFSLDWRDFSIEVCDNFGSVHLVLGNHDTENKERMELTKWVMIAQPNVHVHGITSRYKCWLSHCPIHPDEMRGKVANIHGHVHSKSIDDDRYINVSCEAVGFKPIDLNGIRAIMESRNL